MENITETVNVRGESEDNGSRWMTEKRRSWPCTITIPPSKACTTGTNSDPLRVSVIEDDPTARVLGSAEKGQSTMMCPGSLQRVHRQSRQ